MNKLNEIFNRVKELVEWVWMKIRTSRFVNKFVLNNKSLRRFDDWLNEKEREYNQRKNAEVIAMFEDIRSGNNPAP